MLLQYFIGNSWMVSEDYKVKYLTMLANELNGFVYTEEHIKRIEEKARKESALMYYGDDMTLLDPDSQPTLHNTTAVVTLKGIMTKDGGMCAKGTKHTRQELKMVGLAKEVDSVVLRVDTGGGSVDGTFELADDVRNFEQTYNKPLEVYVDGCCASGGYMVSSGASKIWASSPFAVLGSIGTMVSYQDATEFLEKKGVKIVTLTADDSVNKLGSDDDSIAMLNQAQNVFKNKVLTDRPNINTSIKTVNRLGVEIPEVLSGKIYMGDDALNMGLFDSYGTLEQAIMSVKNRAKKGGNTPTGLPRMEAEKINETQISNSIKLEDMTIAEKIVAKVSGWLTATGVSVDAAQIEALQQSLSEEKFGVSQEEVTAAISASFADFKQITDKITEQLEGNKNDLATIASTNTAFQTQLDDIAKAVLSLRGTKPPIEQSTGKDVEQSKDAPELVKNLKVALKNTKQA